MWSYFNESLYPWVRMSAVEISKEAGQKKKITKRKKPDLETR